MPVLMCGFGDTTHERYAEQIATLDLLDTQGRVVQVPICDEHGEPAELEGEDVTDYGELP